MRIYVRIMLGMFICWDPGAQVELELCKAFSNLAQLDPGSLALMALSEIAADSPRKIWILPSTNRGFMIFHGIKSDKHIDNRSFMGF